MHVYACTSVHEKLLIYKSAHRELLMYTVGYSTTDKTTSVKVRV